ncbi:MAG: hypothetical protein QM731_09485 [Chitinophagaceae bacterium]
MIAYNQQQLDNLSINEAAEQALYKNCITQDEYNQVLTAHPVTLYMPNAFIRIGLFLLTIVIALVSFGLFCLLFLSSGTEAYGGLTLFVGLCAYAMLEFMIRDKKHFCSGVDDALMWISGILIISSILIFTSFEISSLSICLLITVIATFFAVRFADSIMGLVAFLAFLGAIFYGCLYIGVAGKVVAPFLLMTASFGVYLVARNISHTPAARHYKHSLNLLMIASLITTYLAVNYFVVRETSDAMFNLQLNPQDSIPAAWLFWIFTVAIPLLYIYLGIRKKDRILLCTGLILIAAICFTIRYYHHIAPLEVVMILGGAFMIGIAYAVTRYLRTPRHGFTSEAADELHREALQLESLIIAQTMSQVQPDNSFKFGEGSGGGAGASGEF